MATQAWAADLERLKRELLQRIERAASDNQAASSRSNQNTDVTRRLDAVERRLQTTIDQINRTFTSAHTADGRTTSRLDQLERRLQTTIDETNRTFTSAHTADGRTSTRLDQLERRIAEVARAAERTRT